MNKKEIIEKLREDEHYYGELGKKFISNSDIYTLLNNPLAMGVPQPYNINFLVGGYFHTAILEPHKLKNFEVSEATSRNSKAYKEQLKESDAEMIIMQKEVDNLNAMITKVNENDLCRSLIYQEGNTFEEPNIGMVKDLYFKGKADILNHEENLIVDLKTTSDISKFKWSASKYNYDSQAYIYKKLFGYDMVFIVIDKITHQLGIYDCSEEFYTTGEAKVEQAAKVFKEIHENEAFDAKQHIKHLTL